MYFTSAGQEPGDTTLVSISLVFDFWHVTRFARHYNCYKLCREVQMTPDTVLYQSLLN
jgi:hypothetical protein